MFGIAFVSVMIGISCFFSMTWKGEKKNTGGRGLAATLSVIFIIATAIVTLSLILGKYCNQISDFAQVRGMKMKITLLEERRENLTSIIKTELQKYPEVEKEIITNLGPAPSFLFNYPQLKSNLTITKTVDDIVRIQDEVYKMKELLIESLQKIYLREISPWTIYVKSYDKFFGEKNPILTETEKFP